jgi:hypothetical protein
VILPSLKKDSLECVRMLLPASFQELCLLLASTPQHRVRVSPFSHGGSEQSYQGKQTRFEDLREEASCDEDSSCNNTCTPATEDSTGLELKWREGSSETKFFSHLSNPEAPVFLFGVPTGSYRYLFVLVPTQYYWQ